MKLELFKFDSCPYCQRVLRELERSGRTDVELHDTRMNPADRDVLCEKIFTETRLRGLLEF